MGTAEAIEGVFAERPLNEADYQSGLVFRLLCHPRHELLDGWALRLGGVGRMA